MATGQDFIADLQRWSKRSKLKLETLARQSAFQIALATQNNTGPPIGPNIITGYLISSWQPGVNAIPPPLREGETPSVFRGKDLGAELSVTVSTIKLGEVFYYVNNADYAMRQNYGFAGTDALGRQYSQPGKFFLEKTLALWPKIVGEVAADLQMR